MVFLKIDNDKTTLDFFEVQYDIYIIIPKWHKLKMNSSFEIKIKNPLNNEIVPLIEYKLKTSDLDGIRNYYFNIPKAGPYEISFHNYENLMFTKKGINILGFFKENIIFPVKSIKIERK